MTSSTQSGLGQHGDMAAVDLVGGGAHPLGRDPLQFGWTAWSLLATMYQLGLVLHATPGALWANRSLPGGLGRPDDFLLFLGQVAAEAPGGRRVHPHAPVGDYGWVKAGDGELVLLALGCLGLVRAEGGDVDEPGDAVIGARGGDDAPP